MPGGFSNKLFYLRRWNFFVACFLLLQNFSTQLRRPCTCMQTKQVLAGPASVVVLLAGSLGEVGLGSAYSLWSNDRGGSESCSMSFTWWDLRGSRVKKDDRGLFMKQKILEVSIEFRVEVR